MYTPYFGLSEPPFSLSPNPRYMYMSKRHREAMAHLLYGVQQSGGFVQLTGEIGTGKTTLCRCLLSQLPNSVDVALLLNPNLNENELLAAVCDELKIAYPKGCSAKQLIDLLNIYLLKSFANRRHTVLIVDEAQLLSKGILEQIRILTNLETTKQKLLQIILIGQPELSTILQRADMRQLAQRVTARYHLGQLSPQETTEYICSRLKVAGCRRPLFTNSAMRHVYQKAQGIPRLVNVICDRALLGAYSHNKAVVNTRIARRAAREVLGARTVMDKPPQWIWAPATGLAVVVAFTLGGYRSTGLFSGSPAAKTAPVVAAVNVSSPVSPPKAIKNHPPAKVKKAPQMAPGQHIQPLNVPLSKDGTPITVASVVAVDQEISTESPATRVNQHPPLSELLREYSVANGKLEAFGRLVELWNRPKPSLNSEQICPDIKRLGLHCLNGRGTWNNIRAHNRAAILVLNSPKSVQHHVVVKGVQGDSAMLDFMGEQVLYPISQIDPYWFGDYWLLWKSPPFGSERLVFSDTGKDVLWLRKVLKRVPSGHRRIGVLNTENPKFDTELLRHVVGFQKHNGLKANGVVGAEMLIRLNTLLNSDDLPLLVQKTAS